MYACYYCTQRVEVNQQHPQVHHHHQCQLSGVWGGRMSTLLNHVSWCLLTCQWYLFTRTRTWRRWVRTCGGCTGGSVFLAKLVLEATALMTRLSWVCTGVVSAETRTWSTSWSPGTRDWLICPECSPDFTSETSECSPLLDILNLDVLFKNILDIPT